VVSKRVKMPLDSAFQRFFVTHFPDRGKWQRWSGRNRDSQLAENLLHFLFGKPSEVALAPIPAEVIEDNPAEFSVVTGKRLGIQEKNLAANNGTGHALWKKDVLLVKGIREASVLSKLTELLLETSWVAAVVIGEIKSGVNLRNVSHRRISMERSIPVYM
jgi:hypothetical protein